MRDSAPISNEKMRLAVEALTQWLHAGREYGSGEFEQLCVEHADLALELRKLHPLFQLAQAASTSRSFQQTLRDQFGDDAEVTVKLEEAAPLVVPPSGGQSHEPAKAGTTSKAGRYALEDEVARGGMGVIFRVATAI